MALWPAGRQGQLALRPAGHRRQLAAQPRPRNELSLGPKPKLHFDPESHRLILHKTTFAFNYALIGSFCHPMAVLRRRVHLSPLDLTLVSLLHRVHSRG